MVRQDQKSVADKVIDLAVQWMDSFVIGEDGMAARSRLSGDSSSSTNHNKPPPMETIWLLPERGHLLDDNMMTMMLMDDVSSLGETSFWSDCSGEEQPRERECSNRVVKKDIFLSTETTSQIRVIDDSSSICVDERSISSNSSLDDDDDDDDDTSTLGTDSTGYDSLVRSVNGGGERQLQQAQLLLQQHQQQGQQLPLLCSAWEMMVPAFVQRQQQQQLPIAASTSASAISPPVVSSHVNADCSATKTTACTPATVASTLEAQHSLTQEEDEEKVRLRNSQLLKKPPVIPDDPVEHRRYEITFETVLLNKKHHDFIVTENGSLVLKAKRKSLFGKLFHRS